MKVASRLEAALAHADEDVRMRAAELLGWLRAGESLDALRALAQHDASDKVRGAARVAVDRITDADV
jgi:HEAT repeat protein